jgi:hypothetical protein
MALYRFGAFEFDSEAPELQKAGRRVRLRLDSPIRFVLAVRVRLSGAGLQVTSTRIDERSQVPDTEMSDTASGV